MKIFFGGLLFFVLIIATLILYGNARYESGFKDGISAGIAEGHKSVLGNREYRKEGGQWVRDRR